MQYGTSCASKGISCQCLDQNRHSGRGIRMQCRAATPPHNLLTNRPTSDNGSLLTCTKSHHEPSHPVSISLTTPHCGSTNTSAASAQFNTQFHVFQRQPRGMWHNNHCTVWGSIHLKNPQELRGQLRHRRLRRPWGARGGLP